MRARIRRRVMNMGLLRLVVAILVGLRPPVGVVVAGRWSHPARPALWTYNSRAVLRAHNAALEQNRNEFTRIRAVVTVSPNGWVCERAKGLRVVRAGST